MKECPHTELTKKNIAISYSTKNGIHSTSVVLSYCDDCNKTFNVALTKGKK